MNKYFKAHTDKWAIITDFVYLNLNQDITPGIVIESGNVSAKELIWETAGLYRIFPSLEVDVGGRLVNLEMGIDVTRKANVDGTKEFRISGFRTWFDPLVIARFTKDINNKWLFQFSKRWMLRSEACLFGNRKSFLASLNYRFLL